MLASCNENVYNCCRLLKRWGGFNINGIVLCIWNFFSCGLRAEIFQDRLLLEENNLILKINCC